MAEESAHFPLAPKVIDSSSVKLRRHSIVKASPGNIEDELVPHYRRASTGSCHDFCKHGRKHAFEVREKQSVASRVQLSPLSQSCEAGINGVKTCVANRRASIGSKPPRKASEAKLRESVNCRPQISITFGTNEKEMLTKLADSPKEGGSEVLVARKKTSVVKLKTIHKSSNTADLPKVIKQGKSSISAKMVGTSLKPTPKLVGTSSKPTLGPGRDSSESTVEPVETSKSIAEQPVETSLKSTIEPVETLSELIMGPVGIPSISMDEPVHCSSKSTLEPVETSSKLNVEPVETSSILTVEPMMTSSESIMDPVGIPSISVVEPVECSSKSSLESVETSSEVIVEPVETSSIITVEPMVTSSESIMELVRASSISNEKMVGSSSKSCGECAEAASKPTADSGEALSKSIAKKEGVSSKSTVKMVGDLSKSTPKKLEASPQLPTKKLEASPQLPTKKVEASPKSTTPRGEASSKSTTQKVETSSKSSIGKLETTSKSTAETKITAKKVETTPKSVDKKEEMSTKPTAKVVVSSKSVKKAVTSPKSTVKNVEASSRSNSLVRTSSKPTTPLKAKQMKLSEKHVTPLKSNSITVNSVSCMNPSEGSVGQSNSKLKMEKRAASLNVDARKLMAPSRVSLPSKSSLNNNGFVSINARKHQGLKIASHLKNHLKTRKYEHKEPGNDAVEEKTLYVIKMESGNKGFQTDRDIGNDVKFSPQPSSPSKFSPSSQGGREEYECTTSEGELMKNGKALEVKDISKPRRVGTVSSKDKASKMSTLNFRSGKLVEPQSETTTPRRLKFRRATGFGENPMVKVDGLRRSFKRRYEIGIDGMGIPSGPDKVVLRRQGTHGKRDGHRLFNNVIEETANKLAKIRKSKVKALVGAFETVISLQEKNPTVKTVC